MNQNLSQFTKPIKGNNNNDEVLCPYIKIDNSFKKILSVSQPKTLTGAPVDKVCVPNFSSKNLTIDGGKNICKQNLPYHLSFYGKEESNCYSESSCTHLYKQCDPP